MLRISIAHLTVEVFKTNVDDWEDAQALTLELCQLFPNSRINFDMEDADRVLRIEAVEICVEKIIEFMKTKGYQTSILE